MTPSQALKSPLLGWILAFGLFPVAVHAEVRAIVFPTVTTATFSDDYGDPRSGGRVHEGIDIMGGAKMTPLYAAVDGRVSSVEDADEWQYLYYHVNNDTPGTDDGVGCDTYAYASGITRNASVTKGQLVGWMGDSGNAENVGPPLHFEIRKPRVSVDTGDDNWWDGEFGGWTE